MGVDLIEKSKEEQYIIATYLAEELTEFCTLKVALSFIIEQYNLLVNSSDQLSQEMKAKIEELTELVMGNKDG